MHVLKISPISEISPLLYRKTPITTSKRGFVGTSRILTHPRDLYENSAPDMYSTGEGEFCFIHDDDVGGIRKKKHEWLDEVFGIKMHLVYSEGVLVFKTDCNNVDGG